MPRETLIAVRRGTAAAWMSANPTLAAGEFGEETDTLKVKIGNGSTAWNSLAYVGAGGAPTGSAGGVLDGTYPNPGLAAAVAGAGLAETSDVLSVNVDGSTIEISTDSLRVKAGGIGANELASTAVTPTTYGDNAHVGQFTVDADGRITAAANVAFGGTSSPISSGTSFPGSPATNDLFYRTDILGGTIFKYDGTRWRTIETFELSMPVIDAAMSAGITTDTTNICRLVIPWRSTYGFYALTLHAHTIVLTTNNGTNFWTVTFYQVSTSGSVTTSSTFTTAADTVTTHVYHSIALNAVVSSTDVYFQLGVSKTLSPGAIFCDAILSGQLIAT